MRLCTSTWLVLVECKRWERRITVKEVLVLASRAADIRAAIEAAELERQVWVSLATTEGASSNAALLARQFKISLDRVRSAREYAVRLRYHVNLAQHDGLLISDRVDVDCARGSDA